MVSGAITHPMKGDAAPGHAVDSLKIGEKVEIAHHT